MMMLSTNCLLLISIPICIVHGFTISTSTTSKTFIGRKQQEQSSLSSSLSTSTSASALYMSLLQRETGKSQLDSVVYDRYQNLPFPSDVILAEYVWVDAIGNLRSKTRTLPVAKVSDYDRYMYVCCCHLVWLP